jgi:hypothetical protein
MQSRAIRKIIAGLPVIGPVSRSLYRAVGLGRSEFRFTSSPQYWDDRYRLGGNSGAGSYGRLAVFKAEAINKFVRDNAIRTVVEFGSGDGAQLELAQYPHYVGVDVSRRAVEMCQVKFQADANKRFVHTSSHEVEHIRADLAMSLDVIYHLVEDEVYEAYMSRLVSAAERFICIYSSNTACAAPEQHIRHRRFTDWIADHAPSWRQTMTIPNPYPADPERPGDTSWADFYFFARSAQSPTQNERRESNS